MERIEREKKTVRALIALYCRKHHRGGLCPECEELWQYAKARVERCPFQEKKPTCFHCPVHCYPPERREKIRAVMRYAGPRALWRHPILVLFHLLDGLRPKEKRKKEG